MRKRGTARVGKAEKLRCFVERFARGIVLGIAQKPITSNAFDVEQLTVASRNQERHEWKRGLRFGEQWREQMALEMMDADDGFPQREAERVGNRGSDEQRSCEPRSLRVRDAVEFGQGGSRLVERALREGHDAPDMVARGELRDYATVGLMHCHLRMQRVCKQ